eukprot:GGOE01062058.1.p1 GENE.GGOE01062058.1~~GGOE01062058.1.p1  ORF type:complete len:521 (-),score=93.28 GGOE01062058.1:324-1886(-)
MEDASTNCKASRTGQCLAILVTSFLAIAVLSSPLREASLMRRHMQGTSQHARADLSIFLPSLNTPRTPLTTHQRSLVPPSQGKADNTDGSGLHNIILFALVGELGHIFSFPTVVFLGLVPALLVAPFNKLMRGSSKMIERDNVGMCYISGHSHTIDQQGITHAGARPTMLNWALLQQQNDVTSEAVIALLRHNVLFQQLSHNEVRMLKARDEEDAEKLVQGIASSVQKGVVSNIEIFEPVRFIFVDGKTALEVADEVLQHVPVVKKGLVFIFQGLSGTGKGTTVATLKNRIPNAVAWSNGNVFRALTFMLVQHFQREGRSLTSELISHERVQQLVGCLHFGCYRGKYDIAMQWDRTTYLLSEIENTLLKEPDVTLHIPTVAQHVQGEVIRFATNALKRLCAEEMNVLLEGRAETLQHFRSPFRFELVAKDVELLGHRRSAQRIMARALKQLPQPTATPEQVRAALQLALHEIVAQHGTGAAIHMEVPTIVNGVPKANKVLLLNCMSKPVEAFPLRALTAA